MSALPSVALTAAKPLRIDVSEVKKEAGIFELESPRNLDTDYQFVDNIHKRITLSGFGNRIVNHAYFKRMESIYQLSVLRFVNGTLIHTRAQHSKGVGYLAKYAAMCLRNVHPEITEREILCVEAAGLLHDIGHGPFSHTLDLIIGELYPKHRNRHHEQRSQQIAYDMLRSMQAGSIDWFTIDEIHLCLYFIDPKSYKQHYCEESLTETQIKDPLFHPPHLKFYRGLEQIVNNTLNQVDVDKMDYILRDGFMMRYDATLTTKFSSRKIRAIIKSSRIVDGVWTFAYEHSGDIYQLLERRSIFYSNTYLSDESINLDYTLREGLKQANKVLGFIRACLLDTAGDANNFLAMNDNVLLETILNHNSPALTDAKRLIESVLDAKPCYRIIGSMVNVHPQSTDHYTTSAIRVYSDKSNPRKVIPNMRFHLTNQLGEIILVKFDDPLYNTYYVICRPDDE